VADLAGSAARAGTRRVRSAARARTGGRRVAAIVVDAALAGQLAAAVDARTDVAGIGAGRWNPADAGGATHRRRAIHAGEAMAA
ncbi:hypothetical protein ABTI03_19325, partial [Acinetobacter baumannii]